METVVADGFVIAPVEIGKLPGSEKAERADAVVAADDHHRLTTRHGGALETGAVVQLPPADLHALAAAYVGPAVDEEEDGEARGRRVRQGRARDGDVQVEAGKLVLDRLLQHRTPLRNGAVPVRRER